MFLKKRRQEQEKTYKEAYRAFFGVCKRYCHSKEDAKEVFNDAMLKYFEYRNKNKVHEKGKFSLIKKIIVNKCIDHLRKNKIHFEEIEGNEFQIGNSKNDAEFNMLKSELLNKIQHFPPQTRLIFNLYIFEGWPHKKIAQHLGITTNTTSWHINQGKKQILNLLTKTPIA